MAEKRTSKRVSYEIPVEFGLVSFGPSLDPPKYKGYLVDLSDGGVYIKTSHVFKPGINVTLEIEDGDKCYKMVGTVSNANKVPPKLENTVKCGMGIRFTKPDPELLRIYKDKVGT
ncbi:MAG: PilZ domain-containing protein [Proteobacteria bacterium]|nr:PilZ domain-containing protein [Pseudomonadota bacterium]